MMKHLEQLYETRTYSPRIIVVGEQPKSQVNHPTCFYSRLHTGAFVSGRSRIRLLNLGLTWSVSLNLLDPGTWDCELAETRARRVMGFANRHYLNVVACGKRVTEAFGYKFIPLASFKNFFILPHPSGKNAWWHGNTDKAEFFVKENICRYHSLSA